MEKYSKRTKLILLHSLFGKKNIEGLRVKVADLIDKRDYKKYYKDMPFIKKMPYDRLSFCDFTTGPLGNDLYQLIQIIKKKVTIKGKDILIIGCGNGAEIEEWMKEKPKSILALDYLHYDSWKAIQKKYRNVKIKQGDFRTIKLSRKFDIVAGKAVLEHVKDLEKYFENIADFCKKGGYLWQDFGNLWFTCCGPHCNCDYDHLLIKDFENVKWKYLSNVEAQMYIENDLFSRLTYDNYMKLINKSFDKIYLGIGIGQKAIIYKKANPYYWNVLVKTLKHKEMDLLLESVCYLGIKK